MDKQEFINTLVRIILDGSENVRTIQLLEDGRVLQIIWNCKEEERHEVIRVNTKNLSKMEILKAVTNWI